MNAGLTPAMLLLLATCATAGLLLSPASAGAAADGPRPFDDGDRWVVVGSPANAPTRAEAAAAATGLPGENTEYDKASGGDAAAVPAATATQRFRPGHAFALSPDARRELEHEARCGPRVPVRRGFFPWPGWKPNCLHGGEPKRPVGPLLPAWDEP
ncbi:hypothetical protein ABZP36_010580 [Zizania latifolia]